MESKKHSNISLFIALTFIILTICTITLSIYFWITSQVQINNRIDEKSIRNYHIIVTGTYENQRFMQQVYQGANRYSEQFNAVVELYVPGTQAEDVPLQDLLDYASFVNADGVIAFNDSTDHTLQEPKRTNNDTIPLVTTGFYNPNISQISFIGTSYWELGKKIGDEIVSFIHGKGNAIIVSGDSLSSSNYSILLNSIQDKLHANKSINYTVKNELSSDESLVNTNLIVCISEEETIKVAQRLIENQADKAKPSLMGFGTNETCQLYLDKGIITELIAVDPDKIGETAIREIFEYRNKGYANSYIAADVQILRSDNENTYIP